jgi:hypothetical protein
MWNIRKAFPKEREYSPFNLSSILLPGTRMAARTLAAILDSERKAKRASDPEDQGIS